MSVNVLYYVILYYVSCSVWNPGRVATAFATANRDPNKIPNTCRIQRVTNILDLTNSNLDYLFDSSHMQLLLFIINPVA